MNRYVNFGGNSYMVGAANRHEILFVFTFLRDQATGQTHQQICICNGSKVVMGDSSEKQMIQFSHYSQSAQLIC